MKTKILSILSGISTNPVYLLKFTLLLIVSFFCLSKVGLAQVNLVPNPSFEDYSQCPSTLGQIDYATGWSSVRGTSDYFNSCNTSVGSWVGVPNNFWGHQYPVFGNGYAGFAAKYGTAREYLGISLINPLQIGTEYYVSLKVSLSSNGNSGQFCGVNKLGMLFSTVHYSNNNIAPICNCAQVYTNSIITDTLNWIRIKGSFIADSNYSFVSIGRFFSNVLTDSIQVAGNNCVAYYYLDDICVSTDSNYSYNYITTGLKENLHNLPVIIYPNPANTYINIDFNPLFEPYDIEIKNTLGQQVFYKQKIITPIEHIPIESINGNILFIKITYRGQIFNYKVIKLKS